MPVAAVQAPALLSPPVSAHNYSRFSPFLSVFLFPLSVPPATLSAVFPASVSVLCSLPSPGSLHKPFLLLPPALRHRSVPFPVPFLLFSLPAHESVFPAAQVLKNSLLSLFPHCSADSVFPASQLFFSFLSGSVHTAIYLLPACALQKQAQPQDPVLSVLSGAVPPFPEPCFPKLPAVLSPADRTFCYPPAHRNTVCSCFSVPPAPVRRFLYQRSGRKFLFAHRTLPAAAAENLPVRSSRSA